MDQVFQQLKDFWSKLPTARKVALAGTALIAIAALILVITWAGEPEYGVLFSNLDPQDAGKVIEKLKYMKVDYKVENESTILVPKSKVYELRLRLASVGLPNSSIVGYEIFDKGNIGVSDFVQKVNYKRALEGELARTIVEMEGVEGARVHIVMPEKALFKEDQKPPTASVVLKLKPGFNLTRENVKAITYLVARSVEGLEPKNVTVIDSYGRVLSSDDEADPFAKMSSKQYELTRKVEKYLTDKVQSLLDGVLGPGNSIARVTAELNFTQVEQTVEAYDPENTAIRSEQRTEERSSSVDTTLSSTSSQRTNVITNYEINKTVKRIVESVGNIKRLSVAVLINQKELENMKSTPGEDPVQKLTDIIKSTIGFDENRGDQISVVSLPFKPTAVEFVYKETPEEWWRKIGEKIFVLIAVLASIVLIFLMLRRLLPGRRIPTVEVGEVAQVPEERRIPIPQEVGEEVAEAVGAGAEAEGFEEVEEELEAEEERRLEMERNRQEEIRKRIAEYIHDQPEQAAKLIRVWLLEEEAQKWRKS